MKHYSIKVDLTGSSTLIFEIVSCYEICERTGKTPYNVFSTLKEAKEYALNNQPSMHHSDHSNWRMVIRRTTMEKIWDQHFQDIIDLSDWYNNLSEKYQALKNNNQTK